MFSDRRCAVTISSSSVLDVDCSCAFAGTTVPAVKAAIRTNVQERAADASATRVVFMIFAPRR
jgi:hypothetical protein